MKAAVFYKKNNLMIEEIEVPKPKDGEVLIKVEACGICGTDIHIFEGDEGAAKSPPKTVLGHEFSGKVVEVGNRVARIHKGDRVAIDPNKKCDHCYFCKEGLGHFCENMVGIGTTVNGGFAEYCVVPQEQVYRINDRTTYLEAAMAEPLACCIHGIDMCEIKPGDSVAVIGAGMVGLLMVQLARISGAANIIAIEPVESKREKAMELGASITIDPLNQKIKEVLAQNQIKRINTVIECVGKISTQEQAIDIAGKKSVVMMFGLTKPQDELSILPFELFKKEIVLKSSFINPYTQKRALHLIESQTIDVTSMIYEKICLDDLPELLKDSERRNKGKFIICFE